ncbi:thymidylate kinase [Tistlia consotensis]|uniref:Thymidylate kinase n=1 Tax=Tistlia consotensis USBA 355 TaxID=560819 RepID=A0A1Y6CQ84_9PROT|nr:dTMP kinase [Tistlia consotensis]SMF68898.1 thymidylate kinase [Tistlia consotensis USBA 355]SNS01570.1 thymidylate kinase [Tistlia consotensis]
MDRGRGRFITFEGGEGAGKSTQLRRLAARLEALGLAVVATREPGGSPGAEQIRELLIHGEADRWDRTTEALLHSAARRDHLRCTVEPALAAGRWVLSDRFADSTAAYQGYGHGMAPETLQLLYGIAVGRLKPDLTLILDLPVEQGLERAAARRGGGARYEALDRAFHERVREGFLAIAGSEPERCAVLDASGDAEAVERAVWRCVAERLALPAVGGDS